MSEGIGPSAVENEGMEIASVGLVACAYLPLLSPVEVGPWLVTALRDFDGPWLNDRYQHLGTRLLERHIDGGGKLIDRPALLVKADSGADGSFPRDHEYVAVQQALNFGVLDANPKWQPEADNAGWFTFTSDNAEMRLWEIGPDTDLVVLHSGSMVRLTTMGRGIEDDEFTVPAPLELRMPITTASPDGELVAAIWEVGLLVDAGESKSERAARVITTIKWLAKAWRNTPSIDWFDRVVFLRTGFEALFGESGTPKLLPLIRKLFESLETSEDGAHELHWSPAEDEVRDHEKADRKLTDLEHWFQCFSDTRNLIVHEGAEPDLEYAEEGSAYSGPFPQIAQEVLREAVRAYLSVEFGYEDLWRSSIYRKLRDAFGDAQEQLSEPTEDGEQT